MSTEKSYEDLTTPLGSLQEEISSIIETFVHLGVQVHDFQGTEEAKLGLANHINKTILKLRDISCRNDLSNIIIPTDLLNYIQDGRNPDIYTREFVEVVRKINQYLNGKSLAFEKFRDILAASIKQEFPELTSEVDLIKTKTNVSPNSV
ncbi:RNA polymerase II mediator complex subunit [Pichia californica]|uniref:Mediator of RNA polymerase II transcription subunit 10 n=1 Tax=Pichia californica TaxID=460514 RepID=A0A9P6WND7_9ASCO|nr:RNA polymerase II mediator complex subunit [[Candida] californica]KAG0690131.1 RNA polymerase II mediator complex subunit [[Candida] californica]